MPSPLKKSATAALLSLVGMTAIWGWTFLVVKDAIGKMPVMDFLAVRFTVAALVLFLARPRPLLRIGRKGIWQGAVIGFLLGMSYITQTYGLRTVSPGVSGFITGMGVVFTPLVMWLLLRRKVNVQTWIAVALSLAGLAFLSLHGWAFGGGEALTVACAVFVAFQVVALGEWSASYDAYGLTTVQIITAAVMMVAAAAPGGITMPPDLATWGTVVLTAVLATALAFIVQTWAQALISPTRIAIILTMEPVFAGIFSVAAGQDSLTTRTVAGAACVLLAMLVAQIRLKGAGHKP